MIAEKFILITVATLFSVSSAANPNQLCPDGWKHYAGSCYMHHNAPTTWSGAAYHCKLQGARLVEINSNSENQFIHGYFLKGDGRDHWINLHRCGESLWCYLSMETPKFTNWDKIQPDNRGGVYEGCAELWFTGKWHDTPCEEHQPFICERDSTNTDNAPYILCQYLKKWSYCKEPLVKLQFCKQTCSADDKNKVLGRN